MKPLTIAIDRRPLEPVAKTSTGGIWRDERTARAAMAHTTRAALGARKPGEDLAVELDETILAEHTHAAGWRIPIRCRDGWSLILIDVTIRVPDLLDHVEVYVTADPHWAACAPPSWSRSAREEAACRLTVFIRRTLQSGPVTTELVRDLIRGQARRDDARAVKAARPQIRKPLVTAVVTGHKKGHAAKGMPSQHGRSTELFGAENRT